MNQKLNEVEKTQNIIELFGNKKTEDEDVWQQMALGKNRALPKVSLLGQTLSMHSVPPLTVSRQDGHINIFHQ